MSSFLIRSFGVAVAVGGMTLASLTSATTSNAASVHHERAVASLPLGWHQLLKVRSANLFTIATVRNNIWAAGYRVSGLTTYPLLEHHAGGLWHAVRLPARINTADGAIEKVTASSASNLWIFILHDGKNLVARWNGQRWQTETPAGMPQVRTAVTLGRTNTWDFGGFFAAHFTRSGWHFRQLAVAVSSVSAVSATDIWALGTNLSGQPTAAHWNGHRWVYHRVPASVVPAGDSGLVPGGIHPFGPSNVWVDGYATTGTLLGVPLVLHWNGASWRRAYAGPATPFGSLTFITADGSGGLWMTSDFIRGALLHEHHGQFRWVPGPALANGPFEASDLTWLPGTRRLVLTGFLDSEVTIPYGHVEAYDF